MKIGILSDSHHKNDYLKECIEFLKKENCEYLIHAGDICSKDGLDILKDSNLKYIAVFGNNDRDLFQFSEDYNIKKEPYYFKIEDKSFKLMHLPFHLHPDTDIIIFGHTHKFDCEYKNKKLFEISQNAYEIANKHHTWENRVDTMLEMVNLSKLMDK